jgi:hypothetical protein
MDQAKIDSWKPDVEKRLDNLTIEHTRANKFMEHETMTNYYTKPGLIPNSESASGRPPAGFHVVDRPDGHRIEHSNRER